MTSTAESVCAAYEALVRDASALVGPLSDAQINVQPGQGTRWSVAQNLDHLVKANASYLDAMRPVIDASRAAGRRGQGHLVPGLPGRLFLSALEPPPRMRVKAPKTILPSSNFTAPGILDAFSASMASARQLLLASADVDLNATRFQNPFIAVVQVRASTGFLIIAAHGRRHLWQARQVSPTR